MPVSAAAERRRSKYHLPFVMSDGVARRVDGHDPMAGIPQFPGVYAIPLLGAILRPDSVFLFPSHPENASKREAVGEYNVLQPILPEAFEIISGGVQRGELASEAAERETEEERGIQLEQNQLLNSLEPLEVLQSRNGKLARFHVAGYTLQLTPKQAAELRQQEGTQEFSVAELVVHLVHNTLKLRPSTKAALLAFVARIDRSSS